MSSPAFDNPLTRPYAAGYMVNLGRGFRRLWLFFTLIWVSFCGWQIIDASGQLQQAKELKTYYEQAATQAQQVEGKTGLNPLVSGHLATQLTNNTQIIAQQGARLQRYINLVWMVPAVAFVFCWGIPWVARGFLQ